MNSRDEYLKEHFESASKNAIYHSTSTQYELIFCCSELINSRIIKEIKECHFFSILANEVTDCHWQ